MNLPLNKTNDIKQKILITVLIFFAIILATFFFIFNPLVDNIIEKKTVISNLKIENIKNQQKETNMDILTGKLKTIEPQIEKLDSAIVSDSSGLEFIVTMENIAKKNNVIQTLNMKDPLNDVSNLAYKTTPIDINASGKFQDIYKYLDDLESMSYYLNIDELSLSSMGLPGEKNNQANLHLVAFSYWKK